MTPVPATFVYCPRFGESDLAANRQLETSAPQRRGPRSLVITGAILGLIVAGGGLLIGWSTRSSDASCTRFTGCTDAGDANDTVQFLVIAIPAALIGLGLFGLCVWDYRRQSALASQRTVSTVRVTARDDTTDPAKPTKVLASAGGDIALDPSVARRFEAGGVYDVYYAGLAMLSFERHRA